MNVLFLTSDYPPNLLGGVGVYTYQLARYLASRHHQAFVITQTNETPLEYVEHGVRVWRVRPERIRWLDPVRGRLPELVSQLEYSIAVARQLRRVVHQYRIDLIESCESRAEGLWYFMFHRNPPLVIKLHTPDRVIVPLNQKPVTLDWKLVFLLEEWWLRRATQLVGLTKALTAWVDTLYELRMGQVPLVKVPVDTRFFRPPASTRSTDEPVVLYVGRFEFRKGVHVLLRAIPKILDQVPHAKFLFVGGRGDTPWLLDRYRRDPRYGPRIEWRAWATREDVREWYQRSHVCVVPSLWENHPTVCLEAMSCGCAVVASQAGGIPEIIRHDVDGCLVPPGSSYALARAVVKLLTDAGKREALGIQARLRMEAHYDTERVFDETIVVYQRLLREPNGHAAPDA